MSQFNRRIFLQRSAVLTSGIAGLSLLKVPVFGSVSSINGSPVASTKYGRVRGYIDKGINVFKGIPYGGDTSKRRFMPPLPPGKWSDIREAVEYGPSCPQKLGNIDKMSEDCLFLNVFTPSLHDNRKRPVMFYIHGGAYSGGSGSSPLYDGVNLCRRGGVVVVSINHRLNAFGYLYLSRFGGNDFADSGNVGQLDIILALQWVRDNISEFGGDPNNLMVLDNPAVVQK